MELGILHIGLILLFAAIGGTFAFTEAGPRDNRLILVPGITALGAVVGFFAFYLGIIVLWIIGIMIGVGILKFIFSPKVVIVEKNTSEGITKVKIADAEED